MSTKEAEGWDYWAKFSTGRRQTLRRIGVSAPWRDSFPFVLAMVLMGVLLPSTPVFGQTNSTECLELYIKYGVTPTEACHEIIQLYGVAPPQVSCPTGFVATAWHTCVPPPRPDGTLPPGVDFPNLSGDPCGICRINASECAKSVGRAVDTCLEWGRKHAGSMCGRFLLNCDGSGVTGELSSCREMPGEPDVKECYGGGVRDCIGLCMYGNRVSKSAFVH
jgi:hypothetical protein